MTRPIKRGFLNNFLKDDWNPENVYSNFQKKMLFEENLWQGETGYCWLIATLYTIIHRMKKKYPEEFICFSIEYLVFCDKLEKINWFLEHILTTLDLKSDDRNLIYILSHAMTDQGQWQMAENLICKYGLIPVEKENVSFRLKSTKELNASLSFFLRYQASEIRKRYNNGADKISLQKYKEQVFLKSVELLKMFYGEQPVYVKVPKYYDSTELVITPIEFYKRYIRFPFEDYKCIMSDENVNMQYIETFVELDGNVIKGKQNSFLHLSEQSFFEIICKQVQNKDVCWIGCDSGKFQFFRYGIFDDSALNLSKIMGKNFEENLTKEKLLNYKISMANHAMVLYDFIEDGDGITWWRAQNSIENIEQKNGTFYCSNSWIKKFVFYAVVQKKYIKSDVKIRIKVMKPWELFILG